MTDCCPHCGSELQPMITTDPITGQELNWLKCTGLMPHTRPFMARLTEVFASRARASKLMEATC